MKYLTFFLALGLAASLVQPATAERARLIHPLDPALAARVPREFSRARLLGPLAASARIKINVHLAYPNPAAVHQFVDVVSNPRSPMYGRFLTPKQFVANFAPSARTYARVEEALVAGGMHVSRTSPNRKIVQVDVPAYAAERFFHTRLARIAIDGGVHFTNVTPAVIPPELRGVVMSVTGLNDIIRFKPHIRLHPADRSRMRVPAKIVEPIAPAVALSAPRPITLPAPRPNATVPPVPQPSINPVPCAAVTAIPIEGYGPPDIQTAYDYPHHTKSADDGTGATIAIEAAYGILPTDIDEYLCDYGITRTAGIDMEFPDGPSPFNPAESDEVELDTEQTSSQAPGATIKIFSSPASEDFELEDMYNAVVNDPSVDVVTTSFGSCEMNEASNAAAASDDLFTQGSAEGQTMFAAAGDDGAQDCRDATAVNYVDFPSSSPEVGSAGGTTMFENANMTIKTETGWSCDDATCDNGAGGGGVSQIFLLPSWQVGLPGTTSQAYHDEPDLSLVADVNTPYALLFGGTGLLDVGGTSAVAPNLAGLYAEIDGAIGHRLGRAASTIYAPYLAGVDPFARGDFHDITVGDNTDLAYEVPHAGYIAHAGYDDDIGWGSVDGLQFLNNIVVPSGPNNL